MSIHLGLHIIQKLVEGDKELSQVGYLKTAMNIFVKTDCTPIATPIQCNVDQKVSR